MAEKQEQVIGKCAMGSNCLSLQTYMMHYAEDVVQGKIMLSGTLNKETGKWYCFQCAPEFDCATMQETAAQAAVPVSDCLPFRFPALESEILFLIDRIWKKGCDIERGPGSHVFLILRGRNFALGQIFFDLPILFACLEEEILHLHIIPNFLIFSDLYLRVERAARVCYFLKPLFDSKRFLSGFAPIRLGNGGEAGDKPQLLETSSGI
jgi:hypothetical protein